MSINELDLYKDVFFALNTSFTGKLTRKELLDAFWDNGHKNINFY